MRLKKTPRWGESGFAVLVLVLALAASAETDAPFDYFENSWSLIGLKDYPNGTRLTPQNELLLANREKVRLRMGPNRTLLSRKQIKTLLEGWLPVVRLSTEEAGAHYEFTLWATPLPGVKNWKAAYDWPTEGDNFLNWIMVKATNVGQSPTEVCVSTELVATNATATTMNSWKQFLGPGQSATACFRLPFAPIKSPPLARSSSTLSPPDGEKAGVRDRFAEHEPQVWLNRTVRFWRNLLAKGARIEVPCAKSTHALRAAHVCQFIINDRGTLKGGEGFYDDFYIRDGAYQLLQFEEAGFADTARQGVARFLETQRPDGRFETQKRELDGNGQALWTLWQYWKITGDNDFLKRAYPQMRRAIQWTRQARRQAPPGSPFAGVLTNSLADGEFLWDGKHHIVGYDFWNLRGLLCTADAAQTLGETADATDLRYEAAAYRRAIDAAWRRTGLAHFPPSWEKAGTHWGNTETLWPTELFAPDDSRVAALINEVRERHGGGFYEGTIRWTGKPDVIHPYMSAYTTMASLVRGEHDQFVEDFYWYLLHSTATHAFPEGVYFKTRIAWNDTIPHATGAANYAFLLRHALLHERTDELHLLSGVPDWWLADGREIRVENAPTHFGTISLRVRGTAKGVKVKFDPPRRNPPKRVVLHLPESRPPLGVRKGIEVLSRADQTNFWDFPTVVKTYRRLASGN